MNDYVWQKVFGSPLKIWKWKWRFSPRRSFICCFSVKPKLSAWCMCSASALLVSDCPTLHVLSMTCQPGRAPFGCDSEWRVPTDLCASSRPGPCPGKKRRQKNCFLQNRRDSDWIWLAVITCKNGCWTRTHISTHIPEGEYILILWYKNVIDSCAYCRSVRAEFRALLS